MTDLINPNDALLPCPFCGGEPTINASMVDQVSCENHACTVDVLSFYGFSTIEAAIAAWNTRAPPAIDPAAIREAALLEAAAVINRGGLHTISDRVDAILALIGEK